MTKPCDISTNSDGNKMIEFSSGKTVVITGDELNELLECINQGFLLLRRKNYYENSDDIRRLAAVICNGIGIGVSAESILSFCTGVENRSMYPPSDADDFKRCHNLLSAFPEWKEKLKDIGKTHKAWGTVGEHWSEIEEAYLKEDYKAVYDMLDKYRHEVSE